jgi:serine phosphatase RsbU (regulator of sigma subunit)
MLSFEHLTHLPELDPLIERLVHESRGLVVIAGLDPREQGSTGERDRRQGETAEGTATESFLPSGRTTIYRILLQEMLAAHRGPAAVVARDREVFRIGRRFRRRVEYVQVAPDSTYAQSISRAARRSPVVLAIDRLDAETVPAAFEAARSGTRVVSQLDTLLTGADVAWQLGALGATREQLTLLTWIVSVQRLMMLCPHCREQVIPELEVQDAVRGRYPTFEVGARDYRALGCSRCRHTGRLGPLACFDVFRAESDPPELFEQTSLLPIRQYVFRLASSGYLMLKDALRFEQRQLRRSYSLFAASERALAEAIAAHRRKVVELETANRVLQRRTEALISLQDLGQAMTGSGLDERAADLEHLALRVCRHARDVCAADRAVLYLSRPGGKVEILAASGWTGVQIHQQLDAASVFLTSPGLRAMDGEPRPFNWLPPGVSPRDAGGVTILAGLRVPLVAQGKCVGWMIVHTRQSRLFSPGEVALLQTYAHQAALAIQRAGLIEELWQKIKQLEAAQAQLVQKERMERELELARQVQQSVLPRTFPRIPGYAFAAHNEPARQVGGDFYDVIQLDGNHFGLAIADVSDKGMPAALYMALTRSLLLAEARRDLSPRAVLQNVNRLLLELGEPGMFVSVFYGVVEASTRLLTYARAGHDLPLLLREESVTALGGQGTVLGIVSQGELRLSEEQILLSPSDRLVLYTDGLSDVLAPDGRLYSLGQLKDLLRSCGPMAAEALCEATFAGLAAYRGTAEQFDDMTMLVVQVNWKEASDACPQA